MQTIISEQTTPRRERKPATLPPGLEGEARLNLPQVSALTGWGRTKIYAEIKAGRFPQPERSGARCSRWRSGTVIAVLNSAAQEATQ